MSARTVAVLDRKIREIEKRTATLIDSRCEALRLDLALALPDAGPFTSHPNLVGLVNEATDDIAVAIENGLNDAYDQSWRAIDRDLRGILASINRRELEVPIKATLRRPGLLMEFVGQSSTGVSITEDAVMKEADNQWFLSLRYDDSWPARLIAPGRVGVIGRRGRSLFSVYPGLLRVPLIDVLWAFINADRANFGAVVAVSVAEA